MIESDEESAAAESWMDASIRLHLHQQSGHVMDDDEMDDDDSLVLMPPPDTRNSFDSFEEYSGHVIIAELVLPEDLAEDKVGTRESVGNENTRESFGNENTRDSVASNEDEGERRRQTQTSSSPAANPNTHPMAGEADTGQRTAKPKRKGRLARKQDRFKTSHSVSRFIINRTSLPYTIEHNDMTLEWTALINTDQQALDEDDTETLEETMVAMSFKSVEEAREACHAYAPPRMHSFADSPKCHICKKGFNKILRRPSHCKNCGVCVCSSCTVNWPACMLPATYHMSKRKRFFKTCMACDWLNGTFRQSLLSGDLDKAMALQATGNVNARTPFANVRGEA